MSFWSPTRLDASALALEAEEQRIAETIGLATEAERMRRRAEAGPTRIPGPGLLDGDSDYFDSVPWYDLIQSLDVLNTCAERTGLSVVEVLRFAREKCAPSEPWCLFWMEAYLQVLVARASDVAGAAEKISAAAVQERKNLATKGGAARAAKFNGHKEATREKWEAESQDWKGNGGKREFARWRRKELLKEGVDVSEKTITDVWLAPSHGAGK